MKHDTSLTTDNTEVQLVLIPSTIHPVHRLGTLSR